MTDNQMLLQNMEESDRLIYIALIVIVAILIVEWIKFRKKK